MSSDRLRLIFARSLRPTQVVRLEKVDGEQPIALPTLLQGLISQAKSLDIVRSQPEQRGYHITCRETYLLLTLIVALP